MANRTMKRWWRRELQRREENKQAAEIAKQAWLKGFKPANTGDMLREVARHGKP
jgi:hypothetical protein